jgi:para-nitrobenzyl esterase
LQSVVLGYIAKVLRGGVIGSENELQQLNVFAPHSPNPADARLPVVVVIHGGSYMLGAADTLVQDGPRLSLALNCVVVCINYRLGILGFATSQYPQHRGEGQIDSNCGLRDMIAALKWVKKYVHLFNGDPSNVTINGESAGGHAVLMLLANAVDASDPSLGPLFHRAFAQSPPASRVLTLDQNRDRTRQVAEQLGWDASCGESFDSFLANAAASDIVRVGGQLADRCLLKQQAMPFAPTEDGDLITHDIFNGLMMNAAKTTCRVPLLTLYCLNEFTIFRDFVITKKRYKTDEEALKVEIGAFADTRNLSQEWRHRAFRLYNTENSEYIKTFGKRFPKATAFRGDAMLSFPSQLVSVIHALHGAASYLIRFDIHGTPLLRLAASHYVDVPYVFQNVDSNRVLCGPYPVKGAEEFFARVLAQFIRGEPPIDLAPVVDASQVAQLHRGGEPCETHHVHLSQVLRTVTVLRNACVNRKRTPGTAEPAMVVSPLPELFNLWADAFGLAELSCPP